MALSILVHYELSPRIIEVIAPTTDITVQNIYSAIRDWEDEPASMSFPVLISAAGGEDLGGGVSVGYTVTLQNAQLMFSARASAISTGTATSNDTLGTTLTDITTGTFQTDSLYKGCTVFNSTTAAMAVATVIDSETVLTSLNLKGGSRQDWQIGDTYSVYPNAQCNITGGNLVAVDEAGSAIDPVLQSPNTQVVRSSSSSATQSDLEAIQYSSFNGGVTIDVVSGNSGTDFPLGTPESPVDNVSDALSIASVRGFDSLYIVGDITFTTGDNINNFTIKGQSTIKSTITLDAGADVSGTEFYDATITGTLDGSNVFRDCEISTVTYVDAEIRNCLLNNVTITLGGGAQSNFLDCWSGVVGSGTPIIDCGGSGQGLGIRGYSGGIKITNKTGSEAVSIDLNSGNIILDSTVTDGEVVMRGVGTYTDNSTGTATISIDGLISKDTIASAVWDETIASHVTSGSAGLSLGAQQFEGAVHIDTASGNSGTTFPTGTQRVAVDNLADALTIATNYNLDKFHLDSDLTVTTGQDISNYTVESNADYTLTLNSGCITAGSRFDNLTLTGTLNGDVEIHHSHLTGLSEFYGVAHGCIQKGTVTISSDNTKNAIFLDHYTGDVSSPPTIDCNGDGAKLSLRGLTGAALITNKTGSTQKMFIDLYSARVGFNNTVTAGNITVRGVGYIYQDDSTGTTFDTQGLMSKDTVAGAVWDEPLTDHETADTFGERVGKKLLTIAKFLGLK